jgi:hypothetical protein
MPQKVNYSDTTPAADANNQLLKWKADAPSSDPAVVRNIAIEAQLLVASGGSHQGGLCPDPGAAAGTSKFLREDASWVVPTTSIAATTAPDAPPQSPTAMDDEFVGSSLNAIWTAFNGAVAPTTLVSNGWLDLTYTPGASGLSMAGITQATPGTPWEVTAKLRATPKYEKTDSATVLVFYYFGLCIGDGTKFVSFMLSPNDQGINADSSVFISKWTNATTFSANYGLTPTNFYFRYAGGDIYMRIKDDGTNLLFSISRNGVSFQQVFSIARLNFLTSVSKVGIMAGAQGDAGFNTITSCDWFRRTDGGYTPATSPIISGMFSTDGPNFYVGPTQFKCTLPVAANYAWVNQGTAAETAGGNALFLSDAAVGTTSNLRIRKKTIPGGKTTLIAALLPFLPADGGAAHNPLAGIGLRESATGKLLTISYTNLVGALNTPRGEVDVFSWTSATVINATRVAWQMPGNPQMVFLKVVYDGTNTICYVSPDGTNWIQVYTAPKATNFTTAPDEWFYCISPSGNVAACSATLLSWNES